MEIHVLEWGTSVDQDSRFLKSFIAPPIALLILVSSAWAQNSLEDAPIIRVSEGDLPEEAHCKSVDRALKCFMIDASYLLRALREGFIESVGHWQNCGRAPQKLRVH